MRFHVDLQGATGVAGHDELDDPVGAAALGRRVLREPEEPRLAVGQGVERLADDDGLGAAAADPALDRAVGVDDPARAGSRRRRAGDGHDGGDDERAAGPFELGRPGEDAAGHGGRVPRRRPGRRARLTPFSWRIAQTFWRGDRDVDVADAEVPERVDDRVRDRRRRADRRRLADALRADRVVRRRGDGLVELPGRRLDRRREEVVHERPGEVVAVLVVGDRLVQRRGEAHREPAVDLAVDDHRVDDVAAVVDGDEAPDVDLARCPCRCRRRRCSCRTGRSGSAGRSSRPPRGPPPSRRDGWCRPRTRSPGSS